MTDRDRDQSWSGGSVRRRQPARGCPPVSTPRRSRRGPRVSSTRRNARPPRRTPRAARGVRRCWPSWSGRCRDRRPRSASPLRKWLMMLSPALAAGAAVALWFAVDQGPRVSPVDTLVRDERARSSVTAPADAAGTKADRPAPDASRDRDRATLDREASNFDSAGAKASRGAPKELTEDFKAREERAGAGQETGDEHAREDQGLQRTERRGAARRWLRAAENVQAAAGGNRHPAVRRPRRRRRLPCRRRPRIRVRTRA